MGHKLKIDPYALIFAAMLLLVLPLNWFLSAVAAALFHEFCHMAAVWFLGGKIVYTHVRISGATIHAAPMSKRREAACAAAGPMGSLLLLAFIRWIPCVSICAGAQGIYNLLPVYPLDGGRILRCVASEKSCRMVQYILFSLLTVFSIGGVTYFKSGILPIILMLFLLVRGMEIKIPCKRRT